MDRVKYPRTPHLPWSEGLGDDDIVAEPTYGGEIIVVTEKMDGECTSIYSDGFCHARSLDSSHHVSRAWVKRYAATVAPTMKDGDRLCGENLFAKHSIGYENLKSYLYGFALFTERAEFGGPDLCYSWDHTVKEFTRMGVVRVPLLYRGPFNRNLIHEAWETATAGRESEGYVVRTVRNFYTYEFGDRVRKFVRKNHVTTDAHWSVGPVIQNGLTPK